MTIFYLMLKLFSAEYKKNKKMESICSINKANSIYYRFHTHSQNFNSPKVATNTCIFMKMQKHLQFNKLSGIQIQHIQGAS